MESGKLRNKLTIQRATITNDDHGEEVETWATLKTLYGSIQPINGKEVYESAQYKSFVTHNIMIRYYAALTTADRIIFNSRTFNIDNIINKNERNRTMELICIENTNA